MRFLDDFNLIFGGSSKLWLRLLPILDSFYKNFNSNSFSSEFKRLLWAYYLVALYYLYHAIKNNILRALLNYIRYIKITLGWICGMLAPHTFLVILHSFTNYGPALDKFFDFVDRQYLTEDEFDDEYSNVEQEFALHPLSESELFNLDYVFRIIYSPKRGIWVRKHIVKWFRSVIDEEALFFYNSKYYHDFNTYKQFCLDMIERDPKFFWYEPFVRYLDADYAMHLRSWMCISTIGLNNKGRSARLFDFENFLEPLGGDLFEGFVSLPASSNEKYKFQNIYVAVDSPQFDVDKSGLSYRVKIWLDYFKLLKVSKDYKKHYNMKSAKSKLKSETQPKKPTVRTNEIFFGDEKKYEQTKSRFAQSDPNKTKSFDTNLLRIFLWYKFSNRFRKLVVVIYNANQKWNDVITNVFL